MEQSTGLCYEEYDNKKRCCNLWLLFKGPKTKVEDKRSKRRRQVYDAKSWAIACDFRNGRGMMYESHMSTLDLISQNIRHWIPEDTSYRFENAVELELQSLRISPKEFKDIAAKVLNSTDSCESMEWTAFFEKCWGNLNFMGQLGFSEEYDDKIRVSIVYLLVRPLRALDSFGRYQTESIKHWAVGCDFRNRKAIYEITNQAKAGRKIRPGWKQWNDDENYIKYKLGIVKVSPRQVRDYAQQNPFNDERYDITGNNCQKWVEALLESIDPKLLDEMHSQDLKKVHDMFKRGANARRSLPLKYQSKGLESPNLPRKQELFDTSGDCIPIAKSDYNASFPNDVKIWTVPYIESPNITIDDFHEVLSGDFSSARRLLHQLLEYLESSRASSMDEEEIPASDPPEYSTLEDEPDHEQSSLTTKIDKVCTCKLKTFPNGLVHQAMSPPINLNVTIELPKRDSKDAGSQTESENLSMDSHRSDEKKSIEEKSVGKGIVGKKLQKWLGRSTKR